MAPEQILSSRSAKPAVDVYAVGAILFRAVAGHNVFGDLRGIELARKKLGESPPALSTGRSDRVARGFEDVLARALAPSPDDRFEGAEELLTEFSYLRDVASRASGIRSAVRLERPPAPPATSTAGAAKKPGQNVPPRTMPFWTVAAVVVLGVGTVLGAFAARRGSPGSGAAIDAAQCRVVGHSIESTRPLGMRNVLLSISCPEPDAPPGSGAALVP